MWRDIYDYKMGHTAEWMRSGPDFFNRINKIIDEAERVIHFQVYIIEPDETGLALMESLANAARRGVEVNLVVDDFGADKFGETESQLLSSAGVNVRRFEPFITGKRFYVGRRMHHKVMVVDNKIAMVGGINIANRYKGIPDTDAWLDYGVFITGPACLDLSSACIKIMERQFKPAKPRWPKINTTGQSIDPSEVWVRVRKNDWLRNKWEITSSYKKAVRKASKSITIVGGYFLPGSKFRKLLGNASKRGVEIKIIMTRFSDVPVVKYASDYLYGWMLRNNIRIFERKTTMVHGKVAIVDETWSTIGSYNQNDLSAYFSIELNLDIVNYKFSHSFNEHLLEVIDKECVEITTDWYYQNSSIYAKLRRWVSYQLVRLSLRMLFVMTRLYGMPGKLG